jgi:hypothetical protein
MVQISTGEDASQVNCMLNTIVAHAAWACDNSHFTMMCNQFGVRKMWQCEWFVMR